MELEPRSLDVEKIRTFQPAGREIREIHRVSPVPFSLQADRHKLQQLRRLDSQRRIGKRSQPRPRGSQYIAYYNTTPLCQSSAKKRDFRRVGSYTVALSGAG